MISARSGSIPSGCMRGSVWMTCPYYNTGICVYASGSMTTIIFNCCTLTICSCLHLRQKRGNLYNSVSSLIFIRVFPPQKGHISQLVFTSDNLTMKVQFFFGNVLRNCSNIPIAYGIYHKKIAKVKKYKAYCKPTNKFQKQIVNDIW